MEVGNESAVQTDEGGAAQGPRALGGTGATVSLFTGDTEAPVLGQQQWEAIHERRARGQTVSAIARELDLDRKTVRTCLRQASWQPDRRAESASLLDEHRQWLTERAPEVNYSARILWQELRAQRGFVGGYVIVRGRRLREHHDVGPYAAGHDQRAPQVRLAQRRAGEVYVRRTGHPPIVPVARPRTAGWPAAGSRG